MRDQALPDVLGHNYSWVLSHTSRIEVFCGNKSSETIDRRDFLILLCLGADPVSIFQPEIP